MKIPRRLKITRDVRPYMQAILSIRGGWNELDLAKAASLARVQADIERISLELRDEPDLVEGHGGRMVPNPKHTLVDSLVRREIALSRILHVHAEATRGRSRDSIGAKELKERAAQQAGKSFAPLAPPKLAAVKK